MDQICDQSSDKCESSPKDAKFNLCIVCAVDDLLFVAQTFLLGLCQLFQEDRLVIHSFVHPFVCLFVCLFVRSFVRSFVHLFIHFYFP